MKRYYKEIEGKKVFFNGILIKEDIQIINPPEEDILADGWIEYIPEPYVPQPKKEPYTDQMVVAMRTMVAPQLMTLSDDEALKVAALYDTWYSKIDTNVEVGERLWYDDKLYKVRQPHLVQLQYPPSTETLALYEVIQEEHQGTIEDPIPYIQNMALEKDKYYTQYDILYLCYQSMQAMPYDLKDLAAFVKVVN